MVKISVNNLIALYNEYLNDGSRTSFQDFCWQNNYLSDPNSFNFRADLAIEGASELDFDEANIEAKTQKLGEFLKFAANNHAKIDGDISGVVRGIMITALDADVKFSLTEKEAKAALDIPSVIPKHKIPKTNKVLALLKKNRGPIIATVGGLAGAAIASGANTLYGTAITDNATASALSVASKGFGVGLLGTVATLMVIDHATRYYYAKTYGVKSNNDEVVLGGSAKNSKDIDKLGSKLPLNRLIELLRQTDNKITELASSNKLVNKLHAKLLTKMNRNRLHALRDYDLHTNETMMACETMADKTKLHAVRTLIADYKEDANAKYTILAEKTGKHLVADIFSRWQQRISFMNKNPEAGKKAAAKATKKIKKENHETRQIAQNDLFRNTMMLMLTGNSEDYRSIYMPEPLEKPAKKPSTKINKFGMIMQGEVEVMHIIDTLGYFECASLFEVSEDMLKMFVSKVKYYHSLNPRSKRDAKPINVAGIKDPDFKQAYSTISAKMADKEFRKTIEARVAEVEARSEQAEEANV